MRIKWVNLCQVLKAMPDTVIVRLKKNLECQSERPWRNKLGQFWGSQWQGSLVIFLPSSSLTPTAFCPCGFPSRFRFPKEKIWSNEFGSHAPFFGAGNQRSAGPRKSAAHCALHCCERLSSYCMSRALP